MHFTWLCFLCLGICLVMKILTDVTQWNVSEMNIIMRMLALCEGTYCTSSTSIWFSFCHVQPDVPLMRQMAQIDVETATNDKAKKSVKIKMKHTGVTTHKTHTEYLKTSIKRHQEDDALLKSVFYPRNAVSVHSMAVVIHSCNSF